MKNYFRTAYSRHGKQVAQLRCDRGGEFIGNELNDFCKRYGCDIQYAEKGVSQHNGVAESYNLILVNTVRAFMFQCGAPRSFWEFALHNANYVINRSPSSAINNRTRYEMWYR